MTNLLKIASGALVLAALPVSAGNAATILYSGRGAFVGALGTQVTDAYSPAQGYAPGFNFYDNATMSAVFGETDYESTGFSGFEINIVNGETYCAGCNGSFRLTFTSTSVGTAAGVFGAGLDILANLPSNQGPYTALVTFGDSAQSTYALPSGSTANPGFFGITSDRLITSITFGPNPFTTTEGNFQIDNLTIGEMGVAVPEPATWMMMFLGFCAIGGSMRYKRRSTKVAFAR